MSSKCSNTILPAIHGSEPAFGTASSAIPEYTLRSARNDYQDNRFGNCCFDLVQFVQKSINFYAFMCQKMRNQRNQPRICTYTKIFFDKSWTLSYLFDPETVKSVKVRKSVIIEFQHCPNMSLFTLFQSSMRWEMVASYFCILK